MFSSSPYPRFVADATPDDASEEEFMRGLSLTSQICKDTGLVRNYADEYAGPQSFVQRDNGPLMRLQPGPRLASVRTLGDVPHANTENIELQWIQCDSDACKKWRRVDHKTYSLYHGDTWFREAKLTRRTALLEDFPALPTQLSLWFSSRFDPVASRCEDGASPKLALRDLQDFLASVDPHASLTTTLSIVWSELLLDTSLEFNVSLCTELTNTATTAHDKDKQLRACPCAIAPATLPTIGTQPSRPQFRIVFSMKKIQFTSAGMKLLEN